MILAIKGHAIRGEEIIELFERFGANSAGYTGTFENFYYWIEGGVITSSSSIPFNSIQFTLEEFEEKYPYKVGDIVVSHNKWKGEIISAEWCNDEIVYHIRENNGFISHHTVNELQPYKEQETMEEPKELLIGFTKDNEGNWILNTHKDYEIKEVDGKFKLIKKKPKYPKDYKECCNILGIEDRENGYCGYEWGLLGNFQQLYICRDAYWKIASEEMGLDKPWEPDWDNLSTNHEFIKISKGCFNYSSRVLVFPTKEMRDTFYENFKDLIEQCKELL